MNLDNNDLLNKFLYNEIELNKTEIWSKLNKTLKMNKLKEFSNNILKTEYELDPKEIEYAVKYFKTLIDKKIITKNNEVDYNKDTQKIEKIININFNNKTRKFFYKKEKKSNLSGTVKKSKQTSKTNNNNNKKNKNNKTSKKDISNEIIIEDDNC